MELSPIQLANLYFYHWTIAERHLSKCSSLLKNNEHEEGFKARLAELSLIKLEKLYGTVHA